MIAEHFKTYGWVRDNKIGPLQMVHDSSKVRELVKADTNSMTFNWLQSKKKRPRNVGIFRTIQELE